MEKRLLIVDDDVDVVVVIFDVLSELFDMIDTAYSVDEACKMLKENTYTVVFLDINLQYRNGAEVVKFVFDDVENANKKTPFVLISGIMTPKFIDLQKEKFAAFVMKPFDHMELKKIAEEIIYKKLLEEESKPVEPVKEVDDVTGEDLPAVRCVGPFPLDLLEEKVDQMMSQVKKSAKLKQLFQKMNIDRNADNYILVHIGMIINISAAICIKMEWNSDKTLEKFVYAAYLHDMSLASRPDLARIGTSEMLEERRKSLTPEEYKVILEHPNLAANEIEHMNEIPPDVDLIIRQHHELPGESGFPARIGHQKITPLAAVFIVAHSLTDYILSNPQWKMEDFIKSSKSKLHGGHFTKIVRLLADVK